jgi:hypothetical protein
VRRLFPRSVVAQAGMFLEQRGAAGCEGTGMLAGVRGPDVDSITRFVAPDQEAGTHPSSWVEVTRAGKVQLAIDLDPGERWLARIHSHPGEAFHSPIDDDNPGLTADGAVSIVVPFFGLGLRRGLEACALYERRNGRWMRRSIDDLGIELT